MKLSFRNLKRNKRRNLATGMAIAFGFAGILLLGGYVWCLTNYLRVYSIYAARAGHISIFQKNGLEKYVVKPKGYSLTLEDQTKINAILAGIPAVEFYGRELTGSGLIGNGCTTVPFLAQGIEPEVDRRIWDHPEMKKWARNLAAFTRGNGLWAYPPELDAIAIGPALAQTLSKPGVHDEIPPSKSLRVIQDCQGAQAKKELAADANVQLAVGAWDGAMSVLDGEIVAHFSTGFTETDSSAILMPLSLIQKLYGTSNVTRYAIWLKDPELLEKTLTELKGRLAAEGVSADVYAWDNNSISPLYVGTTQFVKVLSWFISLVLASVIVFSIFNSLTITLLEREPEIGTLRALGFTRSRIRGLFLGEFSILASLSLIFGGVLGALAISFINQAKIQFNPPGASGSIELHLVPSSAFMIWGAASVLLLTVLVTELAVRGSVKKGIPTLLSRAR